MQLVFIGTDCLAARAILIGVSLRLVAEIGADLGEVVALVLIALRRSRGDDHGHRGYELTSMLFEMRGVIDFGPAAEPSIFRLRILLLLALLLVLREDRHRAEQNAERQHPQTHIRPLVRRASSDRA